MQSDRLGSAGVGRDGEPVLQVHGHNDNHSRTGNVLNVNARDPGGFSPVGSVI